MINIHVYEILFVNRIHCANDTLLNANKLILKQLYTDPLYTSGIHAEEKSQLVIC